MTTEFTSPYDAAEQTAAYLRARCAPPPVGIVLGSGLGAFTENLANAETFSYSDLPHFPKTRVVGHAGQLVVGTIGANGPRVAALSGRVHLYEGHATAHVVHSVRALWRWGVRAVVFTNAAGCINPAFEPGDLMMITDHINLSGHNPLTGLNDDRMGPRFPDMSSAYTPALRDDLRSAAKATDVALREGVYAGLAGPCYETPAEIRMLGICGADAVGMSTVCEVIAGRHLGLQIAGISCITNYAAGLSNQALSHAEVKATANRVRENFVTLLEDSLRRIAARLEAEPSAS
jgi:purine-nucleoside phosphorylase